MAGISDQRGKRRSRRQVLQGLTLAGGGLAALATLSCRKQEQPGVMPISMEPKRGGNLTLAETTVIAGFTLDPHVNPTTRVIGYRFFYQGLLGYHPRTYEVEPELARSWEQPSQTEYVFHLQPGAKWHNKPPANGRELTADDIVFSLERARTNDPVFQHRSLLDTVDRIQPVGRSTVRITTTGLDASLLAKLSGDGPLVLAPEVVERAGKFGTADTGVGTGPFILTSIEENVGTEYVRNPEYWRPGRPYLDSVRVRFMADPQAAYAAFLAGGVDKVLLPGPEVKPYIARQGPTYSPDWFLDISMPIATPNLTVKPMDDARVTRALRLLIDHDEFRTAYGELYFGRGRYGSIFCTALDELWGLTEEEYARRIFWKHPKDEASQEALALLSAAGFTRQHPLRFELAGLLSPHISPATPLLQAQWRRLGQGIVDTTIKEYPLAEALRVQAQGSFAYAMWGLAAVANDPDPWLSVLFRSTGSRNQLRLKDPTLDSMIDRQRTIFNIQQRKAAVKEIVSYMADHSPGVVVANRYYLNGLSPRVRGHVPEFYLNGRQYESVWLDT